MVSLGLISSRSSIHSSSSKNSLNHVPPSPSSVASGFASSSSDSLNLDDEENITITANRALSKRKGKEKSRDSQDLRFLAVPTQMAELSYSISDIQTRIFEIQELRHKSQSSGDSSNASSVIDQSLIDLDERLQSVSEGIKSINDSLAPLLNRPEKTPTLADGEPGEDAALLRKYSNLTAEWEAVQKDSQVLREELKEDKWLTVFRTVTDQADGMMSSLEKAVNRCQDFIWQVQRRGIEDSNSLSTSPYPSRSDKSSLSYEMFTSLSDSFEQKKKHYMPATTKVLSIIDKGVQDRVTKNGECLRRHAESTQRWRNLKDRITRTDSEMEALRQHFLHGDLSPSEAGSSTSGHTSVSKNGHLATPDNGSTKSKGRTPSSSSTLSRSISPFRKFARRLTGGAKSPSNSPAPPLPPKNPLRTPSSEPPRSIRHRSSMFHFMNGQPLPPTTPERPSHKHSQSLTPESSPSSRKVENNATLKISRPAWNSSTKVEGEDRALTIKSQSPRRPSATGLYRFSEDDVPPVPPLNATYYKRSVSRSSMGSSRPWSPVTSSVSTAQSSNPSMSLYRPPSRAQTPGLPLSPRMRPRTPSHIPAPLKSHWRSMSAARSEADWADDSPTSLMHRAFSPSQSAFGLPPRPPSRSMIPIPSVHVSSASRPSSAMSQYRPDSSMSFRASASRAQTPEGALRMTPRLSKMPPSSFRESASPRTPGSRPASRAGASTPSLDGKGPLHVYVPNPKDPLDAEFGNVVNSLSHSLLLSASTRRCGMAPREGEEIRAQYAFSTAYARKVVTCKLTTLARSGAKRDVKKVMCRVGGGGCIVL
ncbi:hypothetical protein A0H81_05871 [Grifola frondosa]|uniref:GAR domain-containing protein n=1 Tax=Grifola frondosa TaxID=5627 RepID=A0A1C7MAW3_GRIFR|nr:hypothetical protein A0H81_05871 [Grifola frondosa]